MRPLSKAGHQLGADDDRDLFPRALEIADAIRPKAVMLENVRGLFDPVFDEYRVAVRPACRDRLYGVTEAAECLRLWCTSTAAAGNHCCAAI